MAIKATDEVEVIAPAPLNGAAALCRRRFAASALLLAATAVPAGAADVEIIADTATVNLDTYVGTTAHIASGVTVSNGVSATTQAWSVANDGAVNGSNSVLLRPGGSWTNSAGASVSGTATAITFGISGAGGGAGTLDNYGTITGGTAEGVTLFDGGSVTNRAGATISTSAGLNAVSVGQGTSRSVTNSGTISATRTTGFTAGVLMQGGAATLSNTATGQIYGDYNGVFTSASAPLTLTNAGTITGRRGPGVEAAGGGTFDNSGTIQSASDGILFTGAGSITNTGTIRSTGAGRAIAFSGAAAHTLTLGTGSVLGGNVQGGTGTDNLVLAGTGSESIAKFLAFETLSMQGSDWTLTGAGAFTTSAQVQAGTLRVNGTLTSPTVTIAAGGTLGGTGTVIGAVTNNGNVAPGNSIGTLNITGPYTQATGSTYTVEVNATPASDLLNITGTATIQGGTGVNVLAASGFYTLGHRYTILTASGGVTGTYATLTDNAPFVDFALGYDLNNVYLDVSRSSVSFQDIAQTPNQRAAATGTEGLGAGNTVFDAVLMLDAPNAQRAFDLLSGEIHATAKGVLIDDSRFIREAVIDRLRQADAGLAGPSGSAAAMLAPRLASADLGADDPGLGEALAYAGGRKTAKPALPVFKAPPQPAERRAATAWVQGFGNWGRANSDGNAATLKKDSEGVIGGVDVTFARDWRGGVAAGFQRTTLDVADRSSSAGIDTYHLAGYAGTRRGALGLRFGAAHSHHELTTTRQIVIPGFTDSLRGRYAAGATQVFADIGYAVVVRSVAVEPFATLAYVSLATDGFSESGGAAALAGSSSRDDAAFSTLGVRTAVSLPGLAAMTLRGTLGWKHAYGEVVPQASLAFAAGTPFTVAGTPIARDAAAVQSGLDIAVSRDARIGLAYDGQLAATAQDHRVKGEWRVTF